MSTIKSSNEDITINADGSGRSVKFQANGVEKASISSAGAFTSTSIDATKLTGALPAIDGSALTSLTSSQMPAGSVIQQVYTQSVSVASAIETTSGGLVASGIQATITPKQTGSQICVEFISSMSHINTGNYLRAVMYAGGGQWGGSYQLAYIQNGQSEHNYVPLAMSNITSGTAGTPITFEPYFLSGNGANTVRLVHANASYMLKITEVSV